MRARIAALAVLAGACTQQGVCDSPLPDIFYCSGADTAGFTCHGRLINPYTWESNAIASDWVPFPANQQIIMHLKDIDTNQFFSGKAYQITPYVASNNVGSDAVIAAGNLAIVRPESGGPCTADAGSTGCVVIANSTCAQMFLRVVVNGTP